MESGYFVVEDLPSNEAHFLSLTAQTPDSRLISAFQAPAITPEPSATKIPSAPSRPITSIRLLSRFFLYLHFLVSVSAQAVSLKV